MGQQTRKVKTDLRKVSKKAPRDIRVDRIAEKAARHEYALIDAVAKRRPRLVRKERKRTAPLTDIIAYDLETTPIKAGTPELLYITAYSDAHDFIMGEKINTLDDLLNILEDRFLIPRFEGSKFVAWNANNFDVYFVALALIRSDKWIIRPFLTRSKALRGLLVLRKENFSHERKKGTRIKNNGWMFLDGISMLGLIGTTLKSFLERFAPDHQKLDRESFEFRQFDPENPDDVDYAFRDSIGLYHGMEAAQSIVHERFNLGLQPTIGNLGIKIFQSKIPEAVQIRQPNNYENRVYRDFVCRGGYCHLMRKYRGPVWKYDLNQAYAAAMREAELPAGFTSILDYKVPQYAKTYVARISATNPKNIIPFYCIDQTDEINRAAKFATTEINDTWVTKCEYEQLLSEGWKIKVRESIIYSECFNMKEYVDGLEQLRMNAPGGPSGAVGTMIKAIGNNSYGKTLEQLSGLELILAAEPPEGFIDYYYDDGDMMPFVWMRLKETPVKDYHQPQIGAFITAHVRMVVRRAALLSPKTFLYADTDCVIFSSDVTKRLDIDARRYGAWKLEASGEDYMLIAKKVYASEDFTTKHSKGLNVKALTFAEFAGWYAGRIPVQSQAQRQNFMKVMRGSDMFVNRTRKGTAV